MDEKSILAALTVTNQNRCKPPLDSQEVASIATSIGRYEPTSSWQAQAEHWPERYLQPMLSTHQQCEPVFRRMDEIEIEDIDWLWRGFLAGGKLAMISGNPGTGKSTISTDIAARLTAGATWPNGDKGYQAGSVILLSKEDAPEDTIKPRLKLAGADMSKVYILEGVKKPDFTGGKTVEAEFNLDEDLPALENMLNQVRDCRMVVVDPIGNYMGEAKGNDDVSIRKVLAPLAKLAMKYDVAILVIAHLNKNSEKAAIHRTLGSIGFVGICRMVFGAVIDPEDSTKQRRYLLPIKSNIGNDQLGLAYTTETELVGKTEHVKIVWEPEPVTVNIDDLGRKKNIPDNDVDISAIAGDLPISEKLTEAVHWLVWRLAGGEMSQKELVKLSHTDGVTKATLDRAKMTLGIQPRRQGFGKKGGWYWSLPENVNPADYLGEGWNEQEEFSETLQQDTDCQGVGKEAELV